MYEYFTARVVPSGECLMWTGSKTYKGYGLMRHKGVVRVAHRYSFEYYIGEIPEGYDVHHKCKNKACVKPEHLETASHRVHALAHMNIRVATEAELKRRAAITNCKRGHPLTAIANTRGKKRRGCRVCANINNRAYLARKRVKKAPLRGVSNTYKGIYWDYANEAWLTTIRTEAKTVNIGRYKSLDEAAWMQDQYALNLFGNDAKTIFDYS